MSTIQRQDNLLQGNIVKHFWRYKYCYVLHALCTLEPFGKCVQVESRSISRVG